MTIEVVARCVEPGCRCLDTAGIILYRGDDPEEAVRAEDTAPSGYEVTTTPIGD